MSRLSAWLRARLLPVGFLLFLAGFFLSTTDNRLFLNLTYLGLLLPALLALMGDREAWTRLGQHPLWWLLLAFFAYINASGLWAGADADRDPYLKYTVYILLFCYALARMAPEAEQRLMQAFRWAAVAAAVSALHVLSVDAARGGRLYAPALSHPLLTGNVYGLFLVAWLIEQTRADHWPRWLVAVLALPVLLVVLGTQARSPLLGLIGAGLLLALVLQPRYRLPLLVATLAAGLALLLFWQPLLLRGLSDRPQIWMVVFEQALTRPWFGHGLGQQPVFERQYSTLFDAHNVPLAVFFYGGLPGLLLWLALLSVAAWLAWQQRQQPAGRLALLLLAYGVITTFFEAGYFIHRPKANWFYLWLPLACCLRLPWPGRSHNKEPAP